MDDQIAVTRAAPASPVGDRKAHRDIIVVGGSAGALDVMIDIAHALPRKFSGSVFIVSHIGANRSHLPELLSRAGPLPALHPQEGEPIRPGHIYIAPPDRHMLLQHDRIRLSRGPRQHFTRPAVDPLFRSAAEVFGPRAIGVVLSGAGSDGAAGLESVGRAGGVTVVQDPAAALYPEMPRNASAAISVDHVAPRDELPRLLKRLSAEPVAVVGYPSTLEPSAAMDELERPLALTCPECGGALREAGSTAVKEYRCHIGHRFAPEEVLTGQNEEVEHALGVAMRVLNERVELCRQMGENARNGGRTMGVKHWQRLLGEAEQQLEVLQRFLARQPAPPSRKRALPKQYQALRR
jgi:two-component system, chemotaxis family, protein-glutamate methylesterase/glutaminase